jgi:type VI secretion system protein ImpM
MSATIIPAVGFFGKLPSRGDFVRAGLPTDFVAGWDKWCQRMLVESRKALGSAWLPAWLEAPVWRFALPPGCCGSGAALGVWLPSVDSVSRYFPLTIAVVGSVSLPDLAMRAGGFLERAEQAGRDALAQDLPPGDLMPLVTNAFQLASGQAEPAAMQPGWWTDGSPRVAAAAHGFVGMPDAAFSTHMLGDMEPAS